MVPLRRAFGWWIDGKAEIVRQILIAFVRSEG